MELSTGLRRLPSVSPVVLTVYTHARRVALVHSGPRVRTEPCSLLRVRPQGQVVKETVVAAVVLGRPDAVVVAYVEPVVAVGPL